MWNPPVVVRFLQSRTTLLYHDPDRNYFCQACPGGEAAMVAGAAAFATIAGVDATRRLVWLIGGLCLGILVVGLR